MKSRKIKGILNYTPSYNKLIINFELGQIKSKDIIEFIKSSDYSKINLPENKKLLKSQYVMTRICFRYKKIRTKN